MTKGKILKIRMGHEANCSSGMVFLGMLFFSAVLHLPTGLIAAGFQARDLKEHGEISRGTKIVPQVIGLVITGGLFFGGNSLGYSPIGFMAIILGAAFAFSVYIGNKFADKVGYWNMLIVPLINIAVAFGLYWVYVFIYTFINW